MRIGFDGCLVQRTNFGVGTCIVGLAEGLARLRRDEEWVYYVTEPAAWRTGPDGPLGSARVFTAPSYTRWRTTRILWQQLSLPRLAARHRVDLFHAPGYTMPLAMPVPAVLGVFDILAFEHPEFCRFSNRSHYRRMLPRSLEMARRVIVPSLSVRHQILERFPMPSERVSVVPPGIDEHLLRHPAPSELDAVRARFRLPEHFVLFVGNLEPKKNIPRLVAAFADARKAGLEGELILVGGRGWGVQNAVAERSDVRWLGFVTAAELSALYRLASEVALPSLAEGFGLPVIEAMASGVVVIASDVPSVIESDPEAVVRVDPLSADDIAKGLLRARWDRDLREKLRERGRNAAARFSWEQAAVQTWRIYQEALGA